MADKVLVGMSGGVDSSVAAKLLLDRGYDVSGVTLKLFSDDDIAISLNEKDTKTCCALSDIEDARSVAYKLGFDHHVFNFKDNFREYVMQDFVNEYLVGATPNPCISCNKHVKFDKMLERGKLLGFDYIATGHYAEIAYNEDSDRFQLIRPLDKSKDQTYVLYTLTQYQLKHTLFPLANYDKSTVRQIAEDSGLINSRKPDSQDICFVPDGNYGNFIEKSISTPIKSGDFVDLNGNVIGNHKGIIYYTIGQRKGLGMAFGRPMFVINKDSQSNTVTLGEEKDLYSDVVIADRINFVSIPDLLHPLKVTAKTRYSHTEQSAVIEPFGDSLVKITFDAPVRAVTKGQAVVFYDGRIVLGGGVIR